MQVKLVSGGANSLVISVSGEYDSHTLGITDLKLEDGENPVAAKLRLDSLVYAIGERLEVFLWSKLDTEKYEIVLPLAGRGKLEFPGPGILLPENEGMGISFMGEGKPFLIVMDFTK